MGYLFWLALLVFILMIVVLLEIARGLKQITHLKDVPILDQKNMPKVSIIIPACNEEKTIGAALVSVLSLDYPSLEIIVINDRSTDGTEAVLTDLQKQYPQLTVYHKVDLPAGWLGKNHAMHFGAARATGEYLLFTDADIVMEKTTLKRAMHQVLQYGLDHLCMFFENKARGGLLNALFVDTGGALLLIFKPWKARDAKSRYYMGVGAFNLVKKSVYQKVGGHEQVAMHPIDDVMLGKIIKRQGYKQDCLSGYGFVTVEWYKTVRELIAGLMKNTFAVFHYNVVFVVVSVSLLFVVIVLPLCGLIFAKGGTQIVCGLTILVRFFSFAYGARVARISPWYAPWTLVSPFISLYIVIKATATTLINKGITWRGTFYSLEELRTSRV